MALYDSLSDMMTPLQREQMQRISASLKKDPTALDNRKPAPVKDVRDEEDK